MPKHRGVYPINWAIKNLDNETGVTLHKVTRDIDGGDILIQQSLPIEFDDDTESLLTKMDRMALELFKEVWKKERTGITCFILKKEYRLTILEMILIPCSIWTSRNCLPLS